MCTCRLSFKFDVAQSFPETAIKGRISLNITLSAKYSVQVHVQYSSRPEIQVQMNDRAEARRQGLALGNYRTELLLQALQRNIGTITVANVHSGSGLCRRTYQDVSIAKQSKDNSLKLRNNFEILFPFFVCHYYTNV